MINLTGKVALVSGVARGQGRSHAARLAAAGADIVGFDSLADYDTLGYSMARQTDLDETVAMVEKFDRRILASVADVRELEQVRRVVEDGVGQFGRIDIVCANAGISPAGRPFWEIPAARWRDIIDVNLTGVLHTCAAVVPYMIEAGRGGSIIATASGAGLKPYPNVADYTASKFGVVGLVRTMALELAAHRIRADVVCPSTVTTDMVHNQDLYRLFRPDVEHPTIDDVRPVFTAMNPIPQPWLEPEDVSNAVLWLASDLSRFVTGTVLPVDLGLTCR